MNEHTLGDAPIRESVLAEIVRSGVLAEAYKDVAYKDDPQDGAHWMKMRGYRIAKALVDLCEERRLCPSEDAKTREAARRILAWDRRSTRGPGLSVSVSRLLLDDALTLARAIWPADRSPT